MEDKILVDRDTLDEIRTALLNGIGAYEVIRNTIPESQRKKLLPGYDRCVTNNRQARKKLDEILQSHG